MLDRLAARLHAHGRAILAVAIVGAAIAGAFGAGVTSRLSPFGANDPSTQSVQAQNRFQAATGRQIDPGVVALVRSGPVGSPAARAAVGAVRARLLRQPGIAAVFSYYQTGQRAMVSADGRSTYVVAYFRNISDTRASDDAKRIEAAFSGDRGVTLGGSGIANAQANSEVSADLGHAELLAFPFIFLLSLLFFRSLVAAVLPPLLGGLAIVFTLFALRIVSSFVDVSVFAVNFVIGLGLGLAIDYSLFIVSRYREEAARHGFGPEALRRTMQTAGRTVLFSSLTVTAAVASLIIFPQRFLRSMGIGGTICVLLAASLALVVLPALLGVLGPRVNALAPRRLARAAAREALPVQDGLWFRLARFVMRHAALVAVVSAGALVALGIPFAGARFISVSAKVLPSTASARRVDSALSTAFPPGRTAPLELVVGEPARSPALATLSTRLRDMPDVAAVAAPQPAGPRLSMIAVAPVSAPLSDRSQRLVDAVRRIRTPYYLGVTGQTALFIDLKHSLGAHLPIVLAVIVAATLLVLFLMTGSVVLPVKAVVMNALSLSAVFGILVLIFQDGHLQGLLSFHSLGALDATQPIFLMAVGFGLATDYGVFLLSRIKEARDAGASNEDAVAIGVERTGRIVTAAALLFAVAIGAFATSRLVFIKELGLGAALAVLIDASVVRALLVPALMRLLGKWNWWAPAPLRRLHDRIGLRELPAPSEPAAVAAP
ncbi:MAG TPA: MMPL family transporter [Solirubrobacteraceae bacterium]|nr:MMPL family transporter [Solirubrobacteraceae bacterium]